LGHAAKIEHEKLTSSFYAKNEDAASALELKKTLIAYDRSLLVADPRRMEPKKFGGRGARSRRQKVSLAHVEQAEGQADPRSLTVKLLDRAFSAGRWLQVLAVMWGGCFGVWRHVYHG
jgi:hypothetical protein